MGSIYYKELFGVENPRVALVNVGPEEAKGNELVKATYPLMKKLPINFVGNMEARDALSGNYDVLVCDGFTGNVLLKSVEGAVSLVMGELKAAFKSSLLAMIGAKLSMKAIKGIKNKKLTTCPFTDAATIALAKPSLIDLATSITDISFSNSFIDPSFNVTLIISILLFFII